MSSKEIASDELSIYVENLLFNHDIELLSQFVKDMSFEKKEDYVYFSEEDFKGKTDFSLNIEIESKGEQLKSLLEIDMIYRGLVNILGNLP